MNKEPSSFIKRLKSLLLIFALVPILTATQPNTGKASAFNVIATVQPLDGAVDILELNGEWRTVIDATLIAAGYEVRTGDTGWAIINFFDGTWAEILPNSHIIVQEVRSSEATGQFHVSLRQIVGDITHTVEHLVDNQSSYIVETSTVQLFVRGTIFEVAIAEDGQLDIRVQEGHVQAASLVDVDAPAIDIMSGEQRSFDNQGTAIDTSEEPRPTPQSSTRPSGINIATESIIEMAMLVPIVPPQSSINETVVATSTPQAPVSTVPFAGMSLNGIEVFEQPDETSIRIFALASPLEPFIAGRSENYRWIYVYFFMEEDLLAGWSPVSYLELSSADVANLPPLSLDNLPPLPDLTFTQAASVPIATPAPETTQNP